MLRLVLVHVHFVVELERLLHPAVPIGRTHMNEIERTNGVMRMRMGWVHNNNDWDSEKVCACMWHERDISIGSPERLQCVRSFVHGACDPEHVWCA